MPLTQKVVRYGQQRLTRRLIRAVPWLGGLVAVVTVGATLRRKGLLRGACDTALDFTPVVGTMKNLAEAACGRDFFADKPGYTAAPR